MRLRTVNAGSSSVKLSVIDAAQTLVAHHIGGVSGAALEALRPPLEEHNPEATVHRVVHGGTRDTEAVLVGRDTEAELAVLADLAPLHNPPALATLDQVGRLAPGGGLL